MFKTMSTPSNPRGKHLQDAISNQPAVGTEKSSLLLWLTEGNLLPHNYIPQWLNLADVFVTCNGHSLFNGLHNYPAWYLHISDASHRARARPVFKCEHMLCQSIVVRLRRCYEGICQRPITARFYVPSRQIPIAAYLLNAGLRRHFVIVGLDVSGVGVTRTGGFRVFVEFVGCEEHCSGNR